MTHLLHPQLPSSVANAIARDLGHCSIEELRGLARPTHEKATYSATGGTRIGAVQHETLLKRIRELQSLGSFVEFDIALARMLHGEMRLSRGEASIEGIWAFLGCVALPDVVRWRFASDGETPVERFVGGSRGVRSVFGRCWWRGELLFDDARRDADPYWLLRELSEDELTGILDRQRAIVSRRVAVMIARSLVDANTRGIPRPTVGRDVFKRYQRLSAFVCFETLRPDELAIAFSSICERSVLALVAAREGSST